MIKSIRHGDGPKKNIALVQDGVVVNVVTVPAGWTGKADEWQPPVDVAAIESEAAHIGDAHDGTRFVRKVIWNDEDRNAIPNFEIDPENPPEEVIPKPAPTLTVEEKLARVGLTRDELKSAMR
jgi:hypothetical protein